MIRYPVPLRITAGDSRQAVGATQRRILVAIAVSGVLPQAGVEAMAMRQARLLAVVAITAFVLAACQPGDLDKSRCVD